VKKVTNSQNKLMEKGVFCKGAKDNCKNILTIENMEIISTKAGNGST
jgi:hypothetical protein